LHSAPDISGADLVLKIKLIYFIYNFLKKIIFTNMANNQLTFSQLCIARDLATLATSKIPGSGQKKLATTRIHKRTAAIFERRLYAL
jgi:hypothetical protein